MNAKSIITRNYGDNPCYKAQKNKANFKRGVYATLHTALFSLEIVLPRGGDYD